MLTIGDTGGQVTHRQSKAIQYMKRIKEEEGEEHCQAAHNCVCVCVFSGECVAF